MGSNMAQLFAEAGVEVSIWDVSVRPSPPIPLIHIPTLTSSTILQEKNVDNALSLASQNPTIKDKIHGYKDPSSFMSSLGSSGGRLFIFSITHGSPADSVLDQIGDMMKKGDIIVDGGNEHYQTSERRNRELREKLGVAYVGMGVSGGYQSARCGVIPPSSLSCLLLRCTYRADLCYLRPIDVGRQCPQEVTPKHSTKSCLSSAKSQPKTGTETPASGR